MGVNILDRALIGHSQHLELCAVAHASELLQYLLGFWRKAFQLPDHQLHHIVREAFGMNAEQVPYPPPLTVIECQQAIVRQSRNKLDGEERVARRLLVDQFRQWGSALRL